MGDDHFFDAEDRLVGDSHTVNCSCTGSKHPISCGRNRDVFHCTQWCCGCFLQRVFGFCNHLGMSPVSAVTVGSPPVESHRTTHVISERGNGRVFRTLRPLPVYNQPQLPTPPSLKSTRRKPHHPPTLSSKISLLAPVLRHNRDQPFMCTTLVLSMTVVKSSTHPGIEVSPSISRLRRSSPGGKREFRV